MIIVKTIDNKITEQINEADLQKYIDLGYVAVSSDEVDMIEENGTPKWKYKSEDSSRYRVLAGGGGGVVSVNGKTTSTVTLNQDDILDGSNYKQYSQADKTKVSKIVTTGDGSKALTDDGTYKGLTVKKRTGQWGGIYKTFTAPKDGVYTLSGIYSIGANDSVYKNGTLTVNISEVLGNLLMGVIK